jgi:hypothetical protein
LLAVFSAPFYLERNQIKSINSSAFTVSAVVSKKQIDDSSANKNTTASDPKIWGEVVGNSFIGEQAQEK